MAEDWVRLQLGMRLQIGILRYLETVFLGFCFPESIFFFWGGGGGGVLSVVKYFWVIQK